MGAVAAQLAFTDHTAGDTFIDLLQQRRIDIPLQIDVIAHFPFEL